MDQAKNPEAGNFPQDPEFPEILKEFGTLKTPPAFPSGKYRGKFVKFYGNPALGAVVTATWLGAEFRESVCICTNPSWISWAIREDKGTLSFTESVYDGQPCLRIDFKNRFYETRMKNDRELMSIVTFKDASKWISDVNILIPQ